MRHGPRGTWGRWAAALLLGALAGCGGGKGDADTAGEDADGDGHVAEAAGGDDCDDADATVHPGAEETWYDGIDSDCAGDSDFDADGDGHDSRAYGGDDCDDGNGDIHPGASDAWYDGVDSDCDGGGDYDRDGDGHDADAFGGDDCDDTDPDTYPGASDAWYDGVDADCAGDSDYDADGDGYDAADYGGDDCDDADADIHPGASDAWYDGVDSDCDGASDYDRDGDGYDLDATGGDDCDDGNPDIHPGAAETWYDGVDTDCDGGSDYDADGDGHDAVAFGGDDCDDADADVHPGATETWYDGVDTDCAGDSDYDADGDGYEADAFGGDDCDDADASVSPAAMERLGDSVDQDCDGGADTAPFHSLDTLSGSGLLGPRIGELESDGSVAITFFADGFKDAGTKHDTGAITMYLDRSDLLGGAVAYSWWAWEDYGFDDEIDFYADDDYMVWAQGLVLGSRTRYLVTVTLEVASGSLGVDAVVKDSGSNDYDDVEVVLDETDGSLHVTACDASDSDLGWMHGDPADFFDATTASDVYAETGAGDASGWACVAMPGFEEILVGSSIQDALYYYTYDDTDGLAYAGRQPWYAVEDLEYVTEGGRYVAAVSQGEDGIYVERGRLSGGAPSSEDIALDAAYEVDVALDSSGTAFVAAVEDGTTAWLYYGTVGSLDAVELQTGLSSVDDIAIFVTSDDQLVVAVRGDDDIVYTAFETP